ncbi:MAG: long-chain fatty acid--CoA ligase [Pseudomonadota bacterium]
MRGQMQHQPLRIIDILTFAAEAYAAQGVTSVLDTGTRHRQTYPETLSRVGQLAHALNKLGLKPGDRVATLAWNTHRHFELYYAISGIGAVCHTINPRLSTDQMSFIFNHAEDRAIFVDPSLLPVLDKVRDALPHLETVIVMGDRHDMPKSRPDLLSYEELVAEEPTDFDWPLWPEETAAGLCYTSGTTGDPKGALYSHRSTVLHTLMALAGHPQSLVAGKAVLPVVPLFHVNAWGLPFTAPLAGMEMVMPGPHLDGPSLYALMAREEVYSAWGVPTVWAGLLSEIEAQGRPPEGFANVVIGGSAAPQSMIADFENMGIEVNQAWGMTEMSPIGSRGLLPPDMQEASPDERVDAKIGAGRRLFGVDFKLVGDGGVPMPHNGNSIGELYVRGNAVISGYYNNPEATARTLDPEGWFATGDMASVDPRGRLIIRDRSKDLVKSGGEWISSIDLENTAVAHPNVAACAVIAVPHPKWDERPLLVVVPAGAHRVTLEEMRQHLSGQFAPWQCPDDVVFVEVLPMTATGKVSKLTLREKFADYVLPELRNTQDPQSKDQTQP